MSREPRRLPREKPCFLCEHRFLAEWARERGAGAPWQTSEICEECAARLRERAA
jgi:hypothetical protein